MAELKIYRIEQSANTDYDSYDSAVVIAANEDDARTMHPSGDLEWDAAKEEFFKLLDDGSIYIPFSKGFADWTHPKNVGVDLIGYPDGSTFPHIVCASFNAG